VPDGFGDGRGVIEHGDGWTNVYTRFSRSTGPHGEFTRDGAVFVDDERRVLWSSTESPTFERQGVRYEYVARDISRRISAH